jgi:hypothetical protein
MEQSTRDVTMRDKIIISAILAMFILATASGEDQNGKGNQTIWSILAVPADKLFPGSPALQDVEGQTNLLTELPEAFCLPSRLKPPAR